MNDLDWLTIGKIGAIVLFLTCVVIVLFCVLRDRSLRGMRISNNEIQREQITITLPSFALRDFKDRS